ncbi:transporter [Vibrio sp. AK197]
MEQLSSPSVLFDYTSFLGASCKKKWTFLEAMSSVAPVFSVAWKDTIQEPQTPEDRLWEQAMQALSPSHSDESNLAVLIAIAKEQGIEELRLVMPYSLEPEQLELLRSEGLEHITQDDNDHLIIQL